MWLVYRCTSPPVHTNSPGSEVTLFSKQVCEQRVGGDIERNAQEEVGTALVELAGQLTISHVELEQGVTGRQGHFIYFGRIPGGNDVATGIGLCLI